MSRSSHPSPWLHRFALLTVLATFPLLFVGGLVTSTGSALAVPDWPTTFGYNMFLYPLSGMVGGILYEHTHRLLGAIVGMLTVVLAIWLWVREPRAWLRWLGLVALGGVILQGVLGGLRVILLQQTLAILHACLAQAFFALVVAIAFFTSRTPLAATELTSPSEPLTRLRRLCILTTVLMYSQIVFGAILRHTGSYLEAHLVFAGLVTLHIILINVRAWRYHVEQSYLVRPIMLLSFLLMLQLSLGLGAYLVQHTAMAAMVTPMTRVIVTTVHLVVGSLMLATSLLLTLRAYRLPSFPAPLVAGELLSERVSL